MFVLNNQEQSGACLLFVQWSTILRDWYNGQSSHYDVASSTCNTTNPPNSAQTCSDYTTVSNHQRYQSSFLNIIVRGVGRGVSGVGWHPWLGNLSYFDHINAQMRKNCVSETGNPKYAHMAHPGKYPDDALEYCCKPQGSKVVRSWTSAEKDFC